MPNPNYIFEILGNDKKNINLMNSTLWDIKESLFNNLYNAQKNLIKMKRFDINMRDYNVMSNAQLVYNIPFQFITDQNRISFKKSEWYKKIFSLNIVNSHPEMFSYIPMIFIDGVLYTNVYFQVFENITSIIFNLYGSFPEITGRPYMRDGLLISEAQEMTNPDNNSKISIVMMPNMQQGNFNINRGTLQNYVSIPTESINLNQFNNINGIDMTNNPLCFVSNDDTRLYKHTLLDTTYTQTGDINFDSTQISALTNTYTYLNNVYVLNYLQTIHLPNSNEYFKLDVFDMPVSIEGMLIFRRTGSQLLFDHDTTLSLYYPCVYKVTKTHTDDLVIVAFYSDNIENLGSQYNNELSLYYRFNQFIEDKYNDSTIPDIIKMHTPITTDYSISDYQLANVDHVQYKIDTLKSLIEQDGNYYKIYLNKLITYVPRFFVDVSELTDLESRIRYDNHTEISAAYRRQTFTEPCYLFIFRHDSNMDKMIVYIDNTYYHSRYSYYDEKYNYVYIPTRLITSNTIIDVEKFVDKSYSQEITVTDITSYEELLIPSNLDINSSDMFVYYQDENGYHYLNEVDYKLYKYVSIDDIQEPTLVEIDNDDFYHYDHIYFKLINSNYIEHTLIVVANKISFLMENTGSYEFYIDQLIKNDNRNFLLFKNGRLIPRQAIYFEFSEDPFGPHHIRCNVTGNRYDIFTLVYNTNKYTKVLFLPSIDDKGFVDLTNQINKPLDFKWYDIYLNGLKLNESTVEFIAPYMMLIHDVPTRLNLEIYQKNLDSSTEPLLTNDISEQIITAIPNIYDLITEDLDIIPNTLGNIFDDIVIDFLEFADDYVYTQIITFNPDEEQVTSDMTTQYAGIADDNNVSYINPDNNDININGLIVFNPDNEDGIFLVN